MTGEGRYDPEVAIAAALTPHDYLLFRLNAAAKGRDTLPAVEAWRLNTAAQHA